MTVAIKPPADPNVQTVVDELVARARVAMAEFAKADQARDRRSRHRARLVAL